MTFLEGLGLGLASFALSAVSGTVVAVLLIRVINLRSFHWTVFFHPAWETYAVAAALAVGASLAAAAYPAWLVLPHLPPDPAPGRVMQAAEKGPSAALRFALRHCGVLLVRLIPQGSRALHLDLFEQPAVSLLSRYVYELPCRGSSGACCRWWRRGPRAGEWAVAEGTRAWSFPRDHGAHPEYRTEWWYFTGILAAADGRRFGYQLTFFRQGIAPVGGRPRQPLVGARSVPRALHAHRRPGGELPVRRAGVAGRAGARRRRRPRRCAPGSSTGRRPPTGMASRSRPARARSRSVSRCGRAGRRCCTAPAG